MKDLILACGLQKAYFSKKGRRYYGDEVEVLKERLLDFFRSFSRSSVAIYLLREVHQTNDKFYAGTSSYGLVGTTDIEIPEAFKGYTDLIINTSRPNGFYRTPLESELYKLKPQKIIVVGVEAHTNVLFTVEELRNREYEVTVPEALVLSEDEYLKNLSINILTNVLSADVE